MILRHGAVSFAAVFLGGLGNIVLAEVLSTGDDTEREPIPFSTLSPVHEICPILWYRRGGADGELERLQARGYDITQAGASQLTLANLVNFGVLVIAYEGPGFLAGRRDEIQAFIDQGGGVLIHQPNHVGTLDYTPLGFDVEIANEIWCTLEGYTAVITNAAHTITAGLQDADLSGSFDVVGSIGPGYTVLATNPTCASPALAVGTSGLGRVVLDTGNGNDLSLDPGSDLYWDSLFGWLCTQTPISVAASSWGSVKSAYR